MSKPLAVLKVSTTYIYQGAKCENYPLYYFPIGHDDEHLLFGYTGEDSQGVFQIKRMRDKDYTTQLMRLGKELYNKSYKNVSSFSCEIFAWHELPEKIQGWWK